MSLFSKTRLNGRVSIFTRNICRLCVFIRRGGGAAEIPNQRPDLLVLNDKIKVIAFVNNFK